MQQMKLIDFFLITVSAIAMGHRECPLLDDRKSMKLRTSTSTVVVVVSRKGRGIKVVGERE